MIFASRFLWICLVRLPVLLLGMVVIGLTGCVQTQTGGDSVPTQPRPSTQLHPESSRFVQLQLNKGGWWFVRGGDSFLSRGVNVVEPSEPSPRDSGNCYNVLPKFDGSEDAWAESTVDRLRSWHFNTVGAWSNEAIYKQEIYHTRVVWFGGYGGSNDQRLIDVFSEEYRERLEKTALEQVQPFRNEEWLIGYFINNELPWYGDRAWKTSSTTSLVTRYMELSAGAPGKRAVVRFLQDSYKGNWEDFRADWSTNAKDFSSLLFERNLQPRNSRSSVAVFGWAGEVAERYFLLCEKAIRAHDPQHLILGSRFSMEAPAAVLKACAGHSDVISVNHYRQSGHIDQDRLQRLYALTQRPILITEFSWRATENGSDLKNIEGASVTVPTQEDRAAACREYLGELVREPYIIGYHWFQYHDQPPAGRYFDGEDSNFGLVDTRDRPYEAVVDALKEINRGAERRHGESRIALPMENLGAIIDYRPVRVPPPCEDGSSPAFISLRYLDYASEVMPYGDSHGSVVSVKPFEGNGRSLKFESGNGWGAGVIIRPPLRFRSKSNAADFRGAQRVVVTAKAPRGALFHLEVMESGADTRGRDVYEGERGADGELFMSTDVEGDGTWKDYIFEFQAMEIHDHYGNDHGNRTVDTQALQEIHLVFPKDQSDTTLDVRSMKLE